MDTIKTFTCDQCHEEFPRAWTDEEAKQEKEKIFPNIPYEEMALVCDDCFKMIMEYAIKTGLHNA